MGNNLTPYGIAMDWKIIYFLTPIFIFVEKENFPYDDDVELFDFVSNCLTRSFKKLR